MIKFRNITFPVIDATECKAAQLIAFSLGYRWDSNPHAPQNPRTIITLNAPRAVETLKWLAFDPDAKLIRIYDRDYATHKAFDQVINLPQLTEKLSDPTPQPKKPALPTGRPFAIVTFGYPSKTQKVSIRVVRLQSLDDDYLTGYEISGHERVERTGDFKKFCVDTIIGPVVVIRQDIS